MSFARDVASNLVFMDSGKVVAEGPPDEIFARDGNPRLMAFLSRFHG
jgi:polar amino acid transport system ATP-binding protein